MDIYRQYWHNIHFLVDSDPLIKYTNAVLTDKKDTLILMQEALADGSSNNQLQLVKKLAYRQKMRKNFYQNLKSTYSRYGSQGLYTAAREIHHFEGFKQARPLIDRALEANQELSDENYTLRYSILYNSGWSSNWAHDVVELFNDYPEKYHSRQLLQRLLRTSVNKRNTIDSSAFLSKLQLEKASDLDSSIILYNQSLIEKEDSSIKKTITTDYPFSYASLRINKGIIPGFDDNSSDLILPGKKIYRMRESRPTGWFQTSFSSVFTAI
jgi:hypothetical protein